MSGNDMITVGAVLIATGAVLAVIVPLVMYAIAKNRNIF